MRGGDRKGVEGRRTEERRMKERVVEEGRGLERRRGKK